MKRFLAVAAGGLGLGALLRRRRKAADGEPDPAEELRTKLAESRTIVDDRDVDEAGQTTVDQAPDPDPDARRKDVHARAREALDELQ
ncbi:MAG TPA: hypothetical protein VGJ77_12260 [Gaiellaceae bacterium]|jgi:hypothetical protein